MQAVFSQKPVTDFPHSYYRYPARFSPEFAREAISNFSRKGQYVLDPFCGSGTTIIEGLKLGRKCVGSDISDLAIFLSKTKCSPITKADMDSLCDWAEKLDRSELKASCRLKAPLVQISKNLPEQIYVFFDFVLDRIGNLKNPRQQAFLRLVLLSVGQWAVDCSKKIPEWYQLSTELSSRVKLYSKAQYLFTSDLKEKLGIRANEISQRRRIIPAKAEYLEDRINQIKDFCPFDLVVTSPPYAGVHVLYHRWQVDGKRETGAPFWIINGKDGQGEAYYCMGSRKEAELRTYFDKVAHSFRTIGNLLKPKAFIVQLVAFSHTEWQLDQYLNAMKNAGLEEIGLADSSYTTDGRIWRDIPRKRFYSELSEEISSRKELLLIHRRKGKR